MPPDDQPPSPAPDGTAGIPAWRRRTEGEQRWWVALALAAAIGLQVALPNPFVVHPRYVLPAVEAVALVVLVVTHPERMSRRSRGIRIATQALLGLVAANTAISVGLLVHQITGGGHIKPIELLTGGAEIWLTNALVFGLWYWEYDRGGPASRALGLADKPDLLFPQMTDESLGRDW
ncbi:MAG: hypothetical protein JO144_13100, partial [Actinobacteria bacterium]|nr:hypothetical protein [Actinomycetota bacterium]